MQSKIAKNTIMLYIMNIAKMLFPLITLPYLTRVLSTEVYGTVSYVKAVMQYMQLAIDFGFMLSGTKDIVNAGNNHNRLEHEAGNILLARMLIGIGLSVALGFLMAFLPILRANKWYTILSFVVVFMTCFLMDYLFRGLEAMHVITIRFVAMRMVSLILTFLFVQNDKDVLWIPILDILGTFIAVFLVYLEIRKREIKLRFDGLRASLKKIKDSAVYFISDMATTAFGALNTLVIGAFCSVADIAYWSVCLQMINAVQSMYTPLTNGIYPVMIRTRDIRYIKKIFKIFVPIIIAGCLFTFSVAEFVVLIVGGSNYLGAAPVLKALVPLLLISFLSMMLGWPTLGAIGKTKQVTTSTIIAALAQIFGLILLKVCGWFTLINVAVVRCVTELLLFLIRYGWFIKHRSEFVD